MSLETFEKYYQTTKFDLEQEQLICEGEKDIVKGRHFQLKKIKSI
jgi:hypothetical protein